MQAGRLIERKHPLQHYRTVFNQKTGFFVRMEDDGYPEPAWAADGPELIDLSITNYCERGCDFCYRETSRDKAVFMTLKNVEKVISQAKACGTMQIALGGGNPNQHPHFIEILRLIREHDIVPSYTSNGDGLTDGVLRATSAYCGAMAVSVYPPYDEEYYNKLLECIRSYGITVNLHAIIKSDTLDIWIRWLQTPPAFFKFINAIIFLNYKPIRGSANMPDKEKVKQFYETVNQCHSIKIGFDSCSISGIVRWMDTPSYLIEPCEAARFSAFVSEDMKMYPCSFMTKMGYCGNLRKNSLLEIWQENVFFKQFREDVVPERCTVCHYNGICRGGCHLFDSINFC